MTIRTSSGTGYDIMSVEVRVSLRNDRQVKFYHAVDVSIEESFCSLTATASITIPRYNNWIDKDEYGYNQYALAGTQSSEGYFNVGDEIQVFLGYNNRTLLEYSGEICEIEPNGHLLTFRCENKARKLKKNRLLYRSPGVVHLKDLLPIMLKDTGVEVHPQTYEQDIEFGKVEFRNITAAKVLDEWRSEHGIISFFKENKLVVGRSYFNSSAGIYSSSLMKEYTPATIVNGKDVISDDLKITSIDGAGIAVKATSMFTRNNKSLSVTLVQNPKSYTELLVAEVYDSRLTREENERIQKKLTEQMEAKGVFLENYTFKTHHETNLDKSALLEAAKSIFPKYIRSGMEGSFSTFGCPSLKPATSIIYLDKFSPEKSGEYIIKSIQKTWNKNGFRQHVQIPYKIRAIDKQLL